jgi:molybdopterin-guanine dinucleotide biosynthesis protein A
MDLSYNGDMLSIVVQAGGQSSRMGEDKGLVPLAGKALIEHVLDRVKDLGDETLITTNNAEGYAYLKMRTAPDRVPGAGALNGLRTALAASRGEFALVVACDMPLLNRNLLRYLVSRAPEGDVVVPRWDDHFQTLHAVYRRRPCLEAVERALKENRRRMIGFYDDVRVVQVPSDLVARFDPDGLSFFNINTPEDLMAAERLLSQQKE